MARTIYADTDFGRLGATVSLEAGQALVHHVGVDGRMIGWFNLERFEGGKVTPRTIAKLFSRGVS